MFPVFPDAEQVAQDALEHLGYACKFMPDDWEDQLPIIVVARVGGTNDGVTDRARVQVMCWHTDRPSVQALAGQIEQTLLAAASQSVKGVYVDNVRTESAGQHIPDVSPDDRRVIQTVVISTRRQFGPEGS